jgi:hypothetical protein
MKGVLIAVLLTAALAACGGEPSPEEKARADARAVEFVEAAQNVPPPMAELVPQAITSADTGEGEGVRARCDFIEDGGAAPVLLVMDDTVTLKLDGALRVFAADKGSPELPFGGWTSYGGRKQIIDLQTIEGTAPVWRSRVTVRDGSDRVLYSKTGTLRCGP